MPLDYEFYNSNGNPEVSVVSDNTNIADAVVSSVGYSIDEYSFITLNIRGFSRGTTSITVSDYSDGTIYKIYKVTVTDSEITYQSICVGGTLNVPIDFNSESLKFIFMPYANNENGSFTADKDYPFTTLSVYTNASRLPHRSGTFSVKVNETGSFNLLILDNEMHQLKTVVLTISDHQYSSTVIQEKNCSQHEIIKYTCINCGTIEQVEGSEYGEHQWNTVYNVDQASTCTAEGTESIHCCVCNTIREGSARTIPKKEHAYGDWTTTQEPDCTNKGVKEKVCIACRDKVTEEIPAKGHTWNNEYTVDEDSTCTAEGTESIHCSVCNAIQDNSARVISKKEHPYGDWNTTQEPDCTNKGSKEKVCTACGDKVTEEIPAKGHTWNEYTVDEDSTCTAEGTESIHCSVCDVIEEDSARNISMKDHVWNDGVVTTEATTTSEGVMTFTCLNCGETRTETIAKLSSSDDSDTGVPANSVDEGASAAAVTRFLTTRQDDSDPPGSTFGKLTARVTKVGKTSQKVVWNIVPGAVKYNLYGNKCGKTNMLIYLGSITGTSYKHAKLAKGTYYKYMVVAVDNNGRVVAASKVVHSATTGGKVGNYKSVKTAAKKKKVNLKTGKKFKLKAKALKKKLKVKKHRNICYESSDPAVATVSNKGVIKGVSPGKCTVYAYAQNGVFAKVTVTVK